MPAVAVIGGIASAAGAATAFAAATTTIGSIAAGLAFVGGVATALGGITGNKKLMKFGMITGIAGAAVGGIASLANSASDVASNVAGSAASNIMGPPTELAQIDSLGNAALSDTSNALELSFASDAGSAVADSASTGLLGSGLKAGGKTAEALSAAAPSSGAPVSHGLSDPSVINTAANNFAPNASSVMSDAASQLRLPQAAAGDGGAFGNFGRFLQKNPELAKAGAGILSGIGQAQMQQEQMDWKDRTDAERRARINTSILGQRSNF